MPIIHSQQILMEDLQLLAPKRDSHLTPRSAPQTSGTSNQIHAVLASTWKESTRLSEPIGGRPRSSKRFGGVGLVVIGHTQPNTALEARDVATIHNNALSLAGGCFFRGDKEETTQNKLQPYSSSDPEDLNHAEDEILTPLNRNDLFTQ